MLKEGDISLAELPELVCRHGKEAPLQGGEDVGNIINSKLEVLYYSLRFASRHKYGLNGFLRSNCPVHRHVHLK